MSSIELMPDQIESLYLKIVSQSRGCFYKHRFRGSAHLIPKIPFLRWIFLSEDPPRSLPAGLRRRIDSWSPVCPNTLLPEDPASADWIIGAGIDISYAQTQEFKDWQGRLKNQYYQHDF